ncbi:MULTISPECIES: porin [unclassified Variovorax]|uniref:porin n=1 Tax=unclassified Variovorax TaxID=663243 RepID=UPI0013A57C10|nr:MULTISPECIES: porin [unclassified Variovorax]
MKKSLVALAALAVVGVASAQSSVTLFGIVDASISGYTNKSEDRNFATLLNPFYVNQGSVKTSQTVLANSGYNSSRLGFRGTEDLGGGLAASFWLEAPISNDDGQTGVSTFARRSTVSLSGGFGEIRLGRDYTATFWNDTVFDPFGTNGVGTSLVFRANAGSNAFPGFVNSNTGGVTNVGGSNYVRASNMIGYFLPPNLGGFYGQVQYAFNEKTHFDSGIPAIANTNQDTRTGRYVGGRFGYANGPLDVAASYGESTIASAFGPGTTTNLDSFNLGASYDFGPAKLFGEYSRTKNKVDYAIAPLVRANDIKVDGYLLGVTVPVGPGLIRASYGHVKYDYNLPFSTVGDPKADQLALGYVHNLSKRTALYATVAYIKNKNGANLTTGGPAFYTAGVFTPKSSIGYDFGIRHAF